jgi:hypothetical protein
VTEAALTAAMAAERKVPIITAVTAAAMTTAIAAETTAAAAVTTAEQLQW